MSTDQETTMLWKVEPLSPSGTPPLDIDEEWLCFDEEKPAVFESNGEEPALYEEHLTRAQVATKFLEELELKNSWIKEGESCIFITLLFLPSSFPYSIQHTVASKKDKPHALTKPVHNLPNLKLEKAQPIDFPPRDTAVGQSTRTSAKKKINLSKIENYI